MHQYIYLIAANDLPEHILVELPGKSGSLLAITNREARPDGLAVGVRVNTDQAANSAPGRITKAGDPYLRTLLIMAGKAMP